MAQQLHALISVDGKVILHWKQIDPAGGSVLAKHLAIQKGKPYWLPVVDAHIDTSTKPRKKSREEIKINPDHVLRTEIIEDLSPNEENEAKDNEVDKMARRTDVKLDQVQLTAIYELWRLVTGQNGIGQFNAWLDGNTKISDAAFKARLKGLVE